MGSDTTNPTTAEFDEFEQVKCYKHVINLVLLYSIGSKEHYWTTNKVLQVVSIGGKFTAGVHIVECLQDIFTYFGTIQCLKYLTDVQFLYVFHVGIPVFDNYTQVLSVHNLSKTAILHHWLLQNYYSIVKPTEIWKKEKEKFVVAWESMVEEHWNLVSKVECLMKYIVRHSMGLCQ